MKKVKMGKLSEKEKQNALNEVRILASIEHPNVISYKESFFDDSSLSLCIIMELCDGGDVLKKIEYCKLSGNPMKESELWKLFAQMMIGLKTLHDMHIVHRDIKSANLFLTKAGDLKIGDLNVSKI
jgi:NIMA (never in mitosis gene a)-related kinase